MQFLKSLLFLLFSLYTAYMAAQEVPIKQKSKYSADSLLNRDLHFLPVPTIFYGPETGLKGGLSLDYFFNTGENRRKDTLNIRTRTSYAFGQLLYSTRKQLTTDAAWNIFTRGETYFTRGRIGFTQFEENFWGVGNESLAEKNYQEVHYNRYYLHGKIARQVRPKVFLGLSVNFSEVYKVSFERPNDVGDTTQLWGKNGNRVSGLGPNLTFDFRNDPNSPTEGWYSEWSVLNYATWLGSRSTYNEFSVDVRKYYVLPHNHFMGIQYITQLAVPTSDDTALGNIPWRELPRLGGANIMRGMFNGRYRDRAMWSAQAEYRIPINKFLVGAAFVAAGGVANSIQAFSIDDTHITGGGGLRVLLNKKKNVYIRFDFAMNSNGTSAFYFKTFDAF
jgi:outer membrane protein assembly factor BamA